MSISSKKITTLLITNKPNFILSTYHIAPTNQFHYSYSKSIRVKDGGGGESATRYQHNDPKDEEILELKEIVEDLKQKNNFLNKVYFHISPYCHHIQ